MSKTTLLYAITSAIYAVIGLIVFDRSVSVRGRLTSLLRRVPFNSAEYADPVTLAIGGAAIITAFWAGTMAWSDNSYMANAVDLLELTGWFAGLLLIERQFNGQIFGVGWWLCLGVVGLGLISTLTTALINIDHQFIGELSVDIRFILAVATLVLIENIYRNATEAAQWHLNLPCIAIAGMAIYTLLLYGDAVLHRHLSAGLVDGRAVAWIMLSPLILVGIRRQRRWRRSLSLSRAAAFYSTTLVLSGAFLLGLGAAGEVFRSYGAGWGLVAETALLFIGFVIVAIFFTSGSARSHLRLLVLDHFFSRRYDYQREWTRCLDTLGATSIGGLEQRVIRVVADIVDSPAGVLFLRDGARPSAAFVVAGLWNWPEPDAMVGPDQIFIEHLVNAGGILRLSNNEQPWLLTFPQAWLAIALPNPQEKNLLGVVFVAPPRAVFIPDREVIDLLRVAAREISLVIAERQAAEALAHAHRFEEAGKRFAFVAHDIKNISSQLALLLANASDHMENPEFRQDMLATLRASIDKINVMLTRLKAPYVGTRGSLLPLERLAALAASAHKTGRTPVIFEVDKGTGAVAVEDSVFDAVIGHLLDNAIEASAPGVPVHLRLFHDREQIIIEVEDHGIGMNAAFVRDTLFRPFASSKPGGFGLGAFQARELVRAAGGELAVQSVPGRGTTMRVTLPCIQLPNMHLNLELKVNG
jgi:putative PEP-CTERM system histidine kinase